MLALSPASRLLAQFVLCKQRRAISYANREITCINTRRLMPRLGHGQPGESQVLKGSINSHSGTLGSTSWEKKLISSEFGVVYRIFKFSNSVLSDMKLSYPFDETCCLSEKNKLIA